MHGHLNARYLLYSDWYEVQQKKKERRKASRIKIKNLFFTVITHKKNVFVFVPYDFQTLMSVTVHDKVKPA